MTRRIEAAILSSRGFASESAPERKVTVLGAAGGIGQPLSLLMKLNPLVSRLALYDIAVTPGVAADVSHINTRSEEEAAKIQSAGKSWYKTMISDSNAKKKNTTTLDKIKAKGKGLTIAKNQTNLKKRLKDKYMLPFTLFLIR
ncbi:hypothetical protein CASFOL_007649 [Castilleja foliolosa]|uniref:malate dehydrogenase n=1 Tax=Castilleja foliolosa TaxID=1961234 RepID=A0ABD3E142_9LAMI